MNWCPGCQTVLANEQVLSDGTCERSGDIVQHKEMKQWFYRITAYAQELLDDLEDLDWPAKVIVMERNWIGRAEGVEFDLAIAGENDEIRNDVDPLRVFTTRPDTTFGMTFAVISPEHPRLNELTTADCRDEVKKFQESLVLLL